MRIKTHSVSTRPFPSRRGGLGASVPNFELPVFYVHDVIAYCAVQRFWGEDDCVHFRAGVQDVGGVLAIFKLTMAFCNVFRYLHWRITLRGKFCVDETVCCL